jgi:hypothetical protein
MYGMEDQARYIINVLILNTKPSETLQMAYFKIILKAIELDLERIYNYPKINVIRYIVENYNPDISAKDQFLIWYDVNNDLRAIIELESDQIFSGIKEIH